MPQLDFSCYSCQIFWFFICYGLLYLFVHFFASKSAKKSIEDREIALGKLNNKINEMSIQYKNNSESARDEFLQIINKIQNSKANKIEDIKKEYNDLMYQTKKKEIADIAMFKDNKIAEYDRIIKNTQYQALKDIMLSKLDIK